MLRLDPERRQLHHQYAGSLDLCGTMLISDQPVLRTTSTALAVQEHTAAAKSPLLPRYLDCFAQIRRESVLAARSSVQTFCEICLVVRMLR